MRSPEKEQGFVGGGGLQRWMGFCAGQRSGRRGKHLEAGSPHCPFGIISR